MLDVMDGLVQELGDVGVVQAVHDPAAVPMADDETEGPQQAQLVGDRRLFHADRGGELRDRMRATPEPAEDQQAGRSGQGLKSGRHDRRGGGVKVDGGSSCGGARYGDRRRVVRTLGEPGASFIGVHGGVPGPGSCPYRGRG